MSKFVRVKTELRELSFIKDALDDLKLGYAEDERYQHVWSGTTTEVPLLVRGPGATFGLRQGDDGAFEAVGDDMQMTAIRKNMARIQQRYAYHKVVSETEAAGFALVEEQVGQDEVIRLTVRRWS
ncbi:MAG: DUF1257 domain-containing protein [Caldilineaceae bacterium]|nr:DUF1257 domain-containing protein [Caldilineaceae bacterium]